ncbi:unnamed protein product [Protopolystoma xenopodis]|uniref:Uncharacterized protein n=1 Tax=Protopolystoma xenopodis TaxID=117903 RepID=A0A448WT88_9PLAT|nr:unnamed protein product [Protopolystoma xenopodis]
MNYACCHQTTFQQCISDSSQSSHGNWPNTSKSPDNALQLTGNWRKSSSSWLDEGVRSNETFSLRSAHYPVDSYAVSRSAIVPALRPASRGHPRGFDNSYSGLRPSPVTRGGTRAQICRWSMAVWFLVTLLT